MTIVLTGGDPRTILADGFGVGDLLVVAAVLAWTAYAIVSRRVSTPPVTATAIQAVFATATLLPLVAITGLTPPTDAAGVFALAYIVLLPSVAGYALWNIGAARVGTAKAGIHLNLLPLFTVLIAVAFGQALEPAAIVGGSVVVAGVVLTLWTRRSREAMPEVAAATRSLPVADAADAPVHVIATPPALTGPVVIGTLADALTGPILRPDTAAPVEQVPAR
ncbi:hypothetical protein GCM10025870_29580 [Agromyces marinus]|uniref:EamA domain-containing protein n=1 Tax=Agromyces marinus TaxID=1389020 RepID=A0ABM8H505_9MICO|nr:DMT family transporter [Agromyces marinus]BDZ55885.1 hypothetical protein GCM10025870_29580 [Agromyces marinus]